MRDAVPSEEVRRLDTWLWHARFLKTRSDCAELAVSGAVRINRRPVSKPHASVRVGDTLTVALRKKVRVVRVSGLTQRRGPATEARLLYEELPDGRCAPACAAPQSAALSAHGAAESRLRP